MVLRINRLSTTVLHKIVAVRKIQTAGGRLNIKISSYQYRDPHVKEKMVSRPSYL